MATAAAPQEVVTRTEGLKVFPSATGRKYAATYGGYYYVHHSSGDQQQIMRCTLHNGGCHGRIYLSVTYRSRLSGDIPHNHPPDDVVCQRRYATWKLKSAGKRSNEPTSAIVSDHLATVAVDAQGAFPKLRSLERVVQRSRATSGIPPICANSRAELPELRGIFKLPSGEDFLKWDSGNHQDRILIFSTDDNLECLKNSDHWFSDGTFKAQPILFDQLFVIHGLQMDGTNVVCLPLVYCLTPNRTAATYKRILEKLKELKPDLAPISSMSDFEKASLKAFKSSFPNAERRACFFHFRQASFRHIQSDPDLLAKVSDASFSLHLKTLVALAFVPPSHVVPCFEEIDRSQFFRDNKLILDQYMDYFLNTWIGGFDRSGDRKAPLYPITLWNCRSSVLEGLPKTNNFCEGFHNGFSSMLTAHHPTLNKFVGGLLKQQTLTTFRLQQFQTSQVAPTKAAVVKQTARLKAAVERYGSVPTLDYLRGVPHCFQF